MVAVLDDRLFLVTRSFFCCAVVFGVVAPVGPAASAVISVVSRRRVMSFVLELGCSLGVRGPRSLAYRGVGLPTPGSGAVGFKFTPIYMAGNVAAPTTIGTTAMTSPARGQVATRVGRPGVGK